ncbi:MAG: hypothetical protein ACP5XB_07790 [Isosphaeraceae bacterium]
MSDWLMQKIRSEARRLLELAVDDPQLRADLRALATEILQATTDAKADSVATAERERTDPAAPEPLRELTLGQSRSPVPGGLPASSAQLRRSGAGTGDDPATIEALCRRRAEAARWVAESQRRAQEGTEAPPPANFDEDEVSWAEAMRDAFFFATAKKTATPDDISLLDDVAGCFEAVAESLALAGEPQRQRKAQERVLRHVAEAQSALRQALRRLEIEDDPDQESVYEWVRARAARDRVYLRRHMRADDLADPSSWPRLLAEIEQARAGGRNSPMEVWKLELIRHHQASIREGKEKAEDWPAIIDAVDGLVSGGMPPSSRDLRALLLPIIDSIPDCDDLPPNFCRVVREIDRFLATRPEPDSGQPAAEPPAEIVQVARLLGGRSIVLIGGDRRRDNQEALRKAFRLESVIWIETKEHQSIYTFEHQIARPEVVLVLLAIRWSSHAFGEIRHLCEAHGKPLVRLPGGYNPNQVALQILSQSSDQLGSTEAAASPPDPSC